MGYTDIYKSSSIQGFNNHTRAGGFAIATKYGNVAIAQNAATTKNGAADNFYALEVELQRAYPGAETAFIKWMNKKGFRVEDQTTQGETVTMQVRSNKLNNAYPSDAAAEMKFQAFTGLEEKLKDIGAVNASISR